jgi:predicted acylesterase/phospholipase RssA
VLGPGGNKGYIELGALYYCEKLGMLNNITNICGVSVGSIIGLLMSYGMPILDIVGESMATNLIDLRNLMPFGEMIKAGGIFNKDSFRKSLETITRKWFGYIPTLEQLYTETGRSYMAVTTAMTRPINKPLYLSVESEPDLDCISPALLSSNIPGVFGKMYLNDSECVDGGLSNPYPIDQYDNDRYKILAVSVNAYNSSDNIGDYLMQSLQTPMGQLKERIKQHHKSDNVFHLELDIELNSITSFYATIKDKRDMFTKGYELARSIFEQKPNQMIDDEPVYDS